MTKIWVNGWNGYEEKYRTAFFSVIICTGCRTENLDQLELGQIHNPEALIAELCGFEVEYGRNVQTYIYNHIKENIKEDMTIVAEEVLEDDSLLLTINV